MDGIKPAKTCLKYLPGFVDVKLLHHCRICHILAIYWLFVVWLINWDGRPQSRCYAWEVFIGTSQATKAEPMGYGFWSNSQLGMIYLENTLSFNSQLQYIRRFLDDFPMSLAWSSHDLLRVSHIFPDFPMNVPYFPRFSNEFPIFSQIFQWISHIFP